MNSPVKSALTELINTSVLDQTMVNNDHDVANKEQVSHDLVKYLSSSTTPAYSKEVELMSSNDKVNTSNLHFTPSDMQLTQQAHFNSCLPQDTAAVSSNQFDSSVPNSTTTYTADIMLNHLSSFSHQDLQHCLTSSDSFVQESTIYHNSCGFQELQIANPSAFSSSKSTNELNEHHISATVTGNETQYSQDRQASHFTVGPDPNYHPNHQAQLQNCTTQFDKSSESSGSSFKDSLPVLISSFPSSVPTEVSFGCGQDGLVFDVMSAPQIVTSHVRATEKMHVDEPEVIFEQQSGLSIEQYQITPAQPIDLSDVHMKSFSPKECQTHTDATDVPTNNARTECNFQQTLDTVTAAHSSNEFVNSNISSLNIVTPPASFDISTNPHHQPSPSTFNGQTFQQSPVTLPALSDFQGQPNLCPIKDVMTNSQHYMSQQLDSSSPADPSLNNCGLTQSSPYHNNQYQNCNAPTDISESFKNTAVSISPQGLNQSLHIHPGNTNVESANFKEPCVHFNSSLLEPSQRHLAESIDLNYINEREKQSQNFHSNSASIHDSPLFSTSVSTSDQHEKEDYIINPTHIPSIPENDPSKFISFSSNEDPLLSASVCPEVNQTTIPQSLTDYEMTSTSAQGHPLPGASKPSGDITMKDFLAASSLLSSCHGGFHDDTQPFSQLELEAVANSFNVESNSAAIAHSESIMSAVSYEPSYNSFDYNLNSDSVSFPVGDASHYSFCDPCQPDQDASPCTPVVVNDNSGSQFVASSFGLQSTAELPSITYHQPMQVQEVEPPAPGLYHNTTSNEGIVNNTETAMDVSSSMGEKGGGISSSLSYEEIHMSIVKAGNELSKEVNEPKVVNPLSSYFNSADEVISSDPLGTDTRIYSMSAAIFEPDKLDSAAAQVATSSASELMPPPPPSFTTHLELGTNSAQVSDPVTNNCNIFSTILNIQEPLGSSSQLLHQDQLTQQTSLTIPNFLENPDTHVQKIQISNPDHLILANNLPVSQPQTTFTVTTTTPANSDTLVVGSKLSKIQIVELQHPNVTANKLPVLNAAHSSSSFFGHSTQNATDATVENSYSAKLSAQAQNINMTEEHSGQECDPCSCGFLHLGPLPADKTSTLPILSDRSIKFGTNSMMPQKSGSVLTFNALTSASSVSPAPALSSSTNKQSHIIVSLEDLQRLLAQQNLSQPSPSAPQQQPYTTISSSPQTLVLQKHASHSLKLSQPRLLIKGATLPNQPRISHPHHNQQQNRDKLQLLMHQPSQTDHSSTGSLSQRQTETSTSSSSQDNRQKIGSHFQFSSISHIDQHTQHKLNLLQHSTEQQPRAQLQLKPSQILGNQQQAVNLFLQGHKSGEQKLQLVGHQQQLQLVLPSSQQQSQPDQKPYSNTESQLHLPQSGIQKSSGLSQKAQDGIQLAQTQQELLLLLKQQEKSAEFEDIRLQQFHKEHQQHLQPLDAADRTCSDSMKKDYKHLHSLLTRDSIGGGSANLFGAQAKVYPPSNVNLATSGQASLQLTCAGAPGTSTQTFTPVSSAARLSFLPLNSSSSLQFSNSNSTHFSSPLTTLSFVKTITAPIVSKSFDTKDIKQETTNSQPGSFMQFIIKSESNNTDKTDLDSLSDHLSNRQSSVLTHTSTERKRSHTPLSIDLNSPSNSVSEPASPLSSPTACEDGNTQLTLIERSADLQIKSDSMHGVDDNDDDDNTSFDVNSLHKRPSADEFHHSTRMKSGSVPMKIAKPSKDADARCGVNPSTSPEATFDFGSVLTSASNFSFSFGNKEDHLDVFTFGLNGSGTTTTTTDSLLHKDGQKHYRLSSSKPVMKSVAMRATVPTQPVRPTRKQKEHSLKAYYPSKLENMELKILQQPEPHHRARYQTEGSRGAIKDASQQGFPVIKLFGYNKPAKLQVFIGDECGRVKPHGFYQACRVFGKNSTTCQEQEIEDTTVIDVEMLPDNDMTVKLDCVGILKLRNADVERRIGPKRAREKKKTNTRARLVMRCLVDKSDGGQQVLQVVSNPIVCTQPVGQPEICRMSLLEASVAGGGSLFIIGKNFKNKGTSVLFQQLDSNDDSVVWQIEAEIEQEFFQPTHLICKVPPYKDQGMDKPQLAQIVVSCAGKMSDPHTFTYKPVYSLPTSVKQEMLMDTDSTLISRSMPFVSPEALHLNRMVQLSNTHSVATSNPMFQLPQGTIPSSQSDQSSSQLMNKSIKLMDLTSSTPSTAASTSFKSDLSNGCSLGTSSSSKKTLQSFLIEDKCEALSSNISDASVPQAGDGNSSTVHSQSDNSSTSHVVNDNHHQLASGTSSVASIISSDKKSSMTKPGPLSSCSLPSKPFLVVVDPAALHSPTASDKIQQLLQHILEAQGQV